MNKRALFAGIAVTFLTLILGVIVVLTSLRLFQTKETTVAPTVPQRKPQAVGPTPACTLTFTVQAAPQTFKHKVCLNNACQSVDCSPPTTACADSCNLDTDCAAPTHKECKNNTCQIVSGAGNNTCNTDNDCAPSTHKECQNNACVTIQSAGNNTCGSDVDCKPKPTPPPIPPSGNTTLTVGAVAAGVGAIILGILLAF